MQTVDLTHPIAPDMPVYPGTKPPLLKTESTIDKNGFLERKITICSHTGTHIDAPAHLIKEHNTLDMLPIDHFHGPALLINLVNLPGKTIAVEQLKSYQDQIKHIDFLLLHTGWSRYWGSDNYFRDYPVLSEEAGQWLRTFTLKGFGIDAVSVDPPASHDYPVHHALLQQNIIIIENLANLADLPGNQFEFCCFPLRLQDGDGSPIRAVAFFP